jgi:hypothetical protein
MITNDGELALTRLQLGRVERALGALREDVLPQNEERYRLMAEPYVDQIDELRAEIDAYVRANDLVDSTLDD